VRKEVSRSCTRFEEILEMRGNRIKRKRYAVATSLSFEKEKRGNSGRKFAALLSGNSGQEKRKHSLRRETIGGEDEGRRPKERRACLAALRANPARLHSKGLGENARGNQRTFLARRGGNGPMTSKEIGAGKKTSLGKGEVSDPNYEGKEQKARLMKLNGRATLVPKDNTYSKGHPEKNVIWRKRCN